MTTDPTDRHHKAIAYAAHGHGLRRKVVVSGAIKVLQLALGVGSSLLLARWLGASGYGTYSFALAMASLLAIPAQLGWPTLLTREIARFHHEDEHARLRGVLHTAMRWSGLASFALTLVCLAIGYWIWHTRVGHDLTTLLVASLLIPFTAFIGLRAAALRGLDRVLVAQVLDGMLRPGALLLLVTTLFLMGELSARSAMFAQILALCVSFLFGSVVLARIVSRHDATPMVNDDDVAAWRTSMWPLMFVSASQVIMSQADLFVLGLVADTRTVGIYKVAVMVGTQVGFATWLVNAVFAPQIVRLHRSGQYEALRALMDKGVRYTFSVAVPVALAFLLFGEAALDYALGPEYVSAYWPMVVVVLGQLVAVSAGPVGMVLGMTGHERAVARAMAISAVSSVVLTAILAHQFGAMGAALAITVGLVMSRWLLRSVVGKLFEQQR